MCVSRDRVILSLSITGRRGFRSAKYRMGFIQALVSVGAITHREWIELRRQIEEGTTELHLDHQIVEAKEATA